MNREISLSIELLDAEALARMLSVSVRTLQDWRYQGKGPDYMLFGGKGPGSCMVRYSLDDVRRWLEECRVRHAPEPLPGQVDLPPIRRYRKSKSTPTK